MFEKEEDKSLDQVLSGMKEGEIEQAEKDLMKTITKNSQTKLEKYKNDYEGGIVQELEQIQHSKQKDDMTSSCLATTSMALYLCNGFWPLNTQLLSYCLLVAQRTNEKGRLLEILTGEGKSCVIAMVAATYALQGRTVDIVTSSPVLSQRDAEEWREFYSMMKLEVGCNVEDNTKEDIMCYECPIVYGTVETFARDILKTEFLLHDVRKGRKCDIVIVDEVDSMLIDHGLQCTYLNHDVASIGMHHFNPILALIWMHINRLEPIIFKEGLILYLSEPEVFFMPLVRFCKDIDPLQIVRQAERIKDEENIYYDDEYADYDGIWNGIEEGFTDTFSQGRYSRTARIAE